MFCVILKVEMAWTDRFNCDEIEMSSNSMLLAVAGKAKEIDHV